MAVGQEELRSEERHGRMVEGDFRDACDRVHALLLRLTQRLRYKDAEVEVDRRQSQVEKISTCLLHPSLPCFCPALHIRCETH